MLTASEPSSEDEKTGVHIDPEEYDGSVLSPANRAAVPAIWLQDIVSAEEVDTEETPAHLISTILTQYKDSCTTPTGIFNKPEILARVNGEEGTMYMHYKDHGIAPQYETYCMAVRRFHPGISDAQLRTRYNRLFSTREEAEKIFAIDNALEDWLDRTEDGIELRPWGSDINSGVPTRHETPDKSAKHTPLRIGYIFGDLKWVVGLPGFTDPLQVYEQMFLKGHTYRQCNARYTTLLLQAVCNRLQALPTASE